MRKKILVMGLIGLLFTAAMALIACQTPGRGRDGTFTGRGEGYAGPIVVEVDVHRGRAVDIRVVETHDTPFFRTAAYPRVIDAVLNHNNLNIDNLTGATFSTMGLRTAITDALDQAGVNTRAMMRTARARHTPQNITKTADIVVVGGGGAGLAAAVQASQYGASVILIESMGLLGGNTVLAGSIFQVANNPNQMRVYGPNFDNPEWHARQTWDGGDRRGNMTLIRTMTYNALAAANWLTELGTVWTDMPPSIGGGTLWPRTFIVDGHYAENWINPLKNFAENPANNIEILMTTEGRELITQGGRVTGVRATGENGNTYVLNARRGVVMATGGFSPNIEMRMKHDTLWGPYGRVLDASIVHTNARGLTGHGIIMAQEAGADLVDMGWIQLLPWGTPRGMPGGSAGDVFHTAGGHDLKINREGLRFTDESGRRDRMTEAVFDQTGGLYYMLIDGKLHNANPAMAARNDRLVRDGFVIRVDSWEEVTQKTTITDGAQFRRTIEDVNRHHTYGTTDEFGRDWSTSPMMSGLVTGRGAVVEFPFFFTKKGPTIHHTMGGIRIDRHARVLRPNGTPIHGFYAAGEVTGGIHAKNRLGGNAIADVFVFGRIAGRNAFLGEDPVRGQNAAYFNGIPCVCRSIIPVPTGIGVTGVGPEFNPAIFQTLNDAPGPCCP